MFQKFRKQVASRQICACCGKHTDDSLSALTFSSPTYWDESFAVEKDCYLTSDLCKVHDAAFFIRVVLLIPITDNDEHFQWGVWVSLSEENYERYLAVFGSKKELKEEPYFGWFANQLPGYPDCTSIKTNVYFNGGGLRPEILLDHANPHPLCQEQHGGITMKRAKELLKILEV